MELKPLAGKCALVTGAERGIGRAIALRLARDGADIVVNYLSDDSMAAGVVSEIATLGGRARAIRADVAYGDQVTAMFAQIETLDILVNNAGMGIPGALGEIEEKDLDRVLAVNLKGPLLCAQAALNKLASGGRIINISSSTTVYPLQNMSAYIASKAGLKAFTEVWAQELGSRGINVNSVMPGPTSPGMTDQASPEVRRMVAAASPYNRIGRAEEIADVVAFLCGPESRWVSGQHILVNGAARA